MGCDGDNKDGIWAKETCSECGECVDRLHPPSLLICSGNRNTFDAGYGGCTGYVGASPNFNHCGTDSDDGITASLTCSECGECVDLPCASFTGTCSDSSLL